MCFKISYDKNVKIVITLRLPRVLVPTSDTRGRRADPSQVSHDSLDLEA